MSADNGIGYQNLQDAMASYRGQGGRQPDASGPSGSRARAAGPEQSSGMMEGALVELPWYRRHHVGLKEVFVRAGAGGGGWGPNVELEEEICLVLSEYTTQEEAMALEAIAWKSGFHCVGAMLKQAITMEVNADRQRSSCGRGKCGQIEDPVGQHPQATSDCRMLEAIEANSVERMGAVREQGSVFAPAEPTLCIGGRSSLEMAACSGAAT